MATTAKFRTFRQSFFHRGKRRLSLDRWPCLGFRSATFGRWCPALTILLLTKSTPSMQKTIWRWKSGNPTIWDLDYSATCKRAEEKCPSRTRRIRQWYYWLLRGSPGDRSPGLVHVVVHHHQRIAGESFFETWSWTKHRGSELGRRMAICGDATHKPNEAYLTP